MIVISDEAVMKKVYDNQLLVKDATALLAKARHIPDEELAARRIK